MHSLTPPTETASAVPAAGAVDLARPGTARTVFTLTIPCVIAAAWDHYKTSPDYVDDTHLAFLAGALHVLNRPRLTLSERHKVIVLELTAKQSSALLRLF